jgi:hypothetical protein
MAAEALPLPVVLRRFVKFVSHGLGAGRSVQSGAHGSGEQPSQPPALGPSEPVARSWGPRSRSLSAVAETLIPCPPMLRWGGPIDPFPPSDGGRSLGPAPEAVRVLRRLGACSRDVRLMLEAAPLNLTGWAEQDIHTHPAVNIAMGGTEPDTRGDSGRGTRGSAGRDTGGGRRLRWSPCEPSFLALQRLAWRSAGTRTALFAALAPPRQNQAALSSLLEEEQLIPFWARNTDAMHDTAVGGATPAVQVLWPRPF